MTYQQLRSERARLKKQLSDVDRQIKEMESEFKAQANQTEEEQDELRRLVWDYLWNNGPAKSSEIGEALRVPHHKIASVCKYKWFVQDGMRRIHIA